MKNYFILSIILHLIFIFYFELVFKKISQIHFEKIKAKMLSQSFFYLTYPTDKSRNKKSIDKKLIPIPKATSKTNLLQNLSYKKNDKKKIQSKTTKPKSESESKSETNSINMISFNHHKKYSKETKGPNQDFFIKKEVPWEVKRPIPKYPYKARKRRWSGSVAVSYLTNDLGYIKILSLDKSSGYRFLDQYVLEFIKKNWRELPFVRRQKIFRFQL